MQANNNPAHIGELVNCGLGCILAGAVGDALGAAVEFDSIGSIRERFGDRGLTDYASVYGRRGAITDDTQMTLFTLEGLHLAAGSATTAPVDEIEAAYLRWSTTQGGPGTDVAGELVHQAALHSSRAPGNTCLSALRNAAAGAPRGTTDNRINNSKGCGAVMRAAPVAFWSEDPTEVFRLAVASGALTHGHPSGYLPAGVLAVIVQQIVHGRDLDAAVRLARTELLSWDDRTETITALDAAARLALEDPLASPERIARTLGAGWVGEQALAIGLYAAMVSESVEDGLLLAVNHSGDSDSTGAICGNILGALHGREGVPTAWLEELELRELMESWAADAITGLVARPGTRTTM